MKTVALALTAAAVVAAGAAAQPVRSTTTVAGYGLSIAVPSGWEARIYQLSPDDAVTLEAATFPLPPPGEWVTHDRLGPGDAYIVVNDVGTRGVFGPPTPLPIAVQADEIRGPYEGGFPAGVASTAVVADRDLMYRVFFASQPTGADIDAVNGVLESFSASAGR